MISADRAVQVANSFRRDEIAAIVSLFRAMREGRDVRQIMRGEPIRTLEAKFVRMSRKAGAR
jgi:hypothetical protein